MLAFLKKFRIGTLFAEIDKMQLEADNRKKEWRI
jgi:hypothetical protein